MSSSSSSNQKPFTCLPKLTDAKKDLLRAHSGCFKCHPFNAGNSSNSTSCPGFPVGAGYKPITKNADVAGQPAVRTVPSTQTKGVMATIENIDSDDGEVVAAFIPSATLGNGTDSGGLDSMSDIAPFKCKHFVWKCSIDGPLPEFPLTISSLVDNSCHLVLIRPDIVEKLGLNVFSLETPELINVAIKDCKEKKKLELDKFVILSATSSDQKWSSKQV